MLMAIQKVKAGSSLKRFGNSSVDRDGRIAIRPDEALAGQVNASCLVQVMMIPDQSPTANVYIDATMGWEITVTDERLIFWSPLHTRLVGAPKQKSGVATAGFLSLGDIDSVTVDQKGADSDNSGQCYIGIGATMKEGPQHGLITRIEASRDDLQTLLTTLVAAVGRHMGDSLTKFGREQMDRFAEHALESLPVPEDDDNTLVLSPAVMWVNAANGITQSPETGTASEG